MQEDQQTFLERITQNQNFVFATFAVILFPLMLHTAHLLLLVSSLTDQWYAYSFALGFDLAILHFAVNGRLAQAGAMAFVIFIINVCFYNSTLMFEKFDPGVVKLIITLVISATSAWVVHTYVVLFVGRKEKQDRVRQLIEKNYQSELEIKRLVNDLAEMEQIKQSLSSELAASKEKDHEIDKLQTLLAGFQQNAPGGIDCRLCRNSFKSDSEYKRFQQTCRTCGPLSQPPSFGDSLLAELTKAHD